MENNYCCYIGGKGRNKGNGFVNWSDEEAEKDAIERGVYQRPIETVSELDERGAFVRQPVRFTAPCGNGEGEWPAEAGRYRLIWGKPCNWSNRAAIVRELLGLDDAISVNIAGHSGESNKFGWGFPDDVNHEDPVLGIKFLSEAYLKADPNYGGRCTVPALIDVTTGKVVNNDYHRLTNYFEKDFKEWQAADAPELYPEELRDDIDRFNEWLYINVNNARYRMAFCSSLVAYKEGYDDFYAAMDELEERLSTNRFLFGDYVTDSDVRFYVTLVRWDTHYYASLGPLGRRVKDYPNIWAYCRDLYVIPAFKNNTYFRDFARRDKEGGLFESFNARFVDQIDYESIFSEPQNRKELSKNPEEKFLHRKE